MSERVPVELGALSYEAAQDMRTSGLEFSLRIVEMVREMTRRVREVSGDPDASICWSHAPCRRAIVFEAMVLPEAIAAVRAA